MFLFDRNSSLANLCKNWLDTTRQRVNSLSLAACRLFNGKFDRCGDPDSTLARELPHHPIRLLVLNMYRHRGNPP